MNFKPNPVLAEILSSEITIDADGVKRPVYPTSVTKNTVQRLYHLVRSIRPRQTLEVGFAYGVSTLCICQALQENNFGQHIAIDPVESSFWGNAGILAVRCAGLENILEVIEEKSQTALGRLASKEKLSVDIAFIDGSHLFEDAFVDFYWINQMLKPGGIIVFDDAARPAISKIIRFAKKNMGYAVYPTPIDPIKGLTIKERLAILFSKSQIRALRRDPEFVRRWDDKFKSF